MLRLRCAIPAFQKQILWIRSDCKRLDKYKLDKYKLDKYNSMYTYHRKPVTVPAEPPVHVVAALMRPARHDVLHRPREDVTVVRQTRCERRPVVKYVPVKKKNKSFVKDVSMR